MYLINIDIQPDGSLPPGSWIKTEATDKYQAIQAACNLLKLEQLPFEVHVADSRHCYPGGSPYMTTGYTIAITGED